MLLVATVMEHERGCLVSDRRVIKRFVGLLK